MKNNIPSIRFTVAPCCLGKLLVAITPKGVCDIALGDDDESLTSELLQRCPTATRADSDPELRTMLARIVAILETPKGRCEIPLDIQGTAFQQKVWERLRKIPCGETRSYTALAEAVGRPDAVRAVASAIAANRHAVVIPCHRVVRSDGQLSGYRWGPNRKRALLEREA